MRLKKKNIYEILYSTNTDFLFNYFDFLNKINLYHCDELLKKKFLTKVQFIKIKKQARYLSKKDYKPLIKKIYKRGYYFEFENYFKRKCGTDIAGKMHIGRSRNEIDSCISRLLMKRNLSSFCKNVINITTTLVNNFSENSNYFPYYTQNQPASFVRVNHYFNNIIFTLYEYLDKIFSSNSSINHSPLGSCGLNGSDFNLNYKKISRKLNFKFMEKNSIKSVSDYEYLIYYINLSNIIITKLSRMFHDFIFFQSYEINYIKLSKKYSGKSSYFPHKSNPYLIEKCLSLSNELNNYNNLISNGLRKTINSNSFEFKNLIYQSYNFFDKFSDFINISKKILDNTHFNEKILDNKYYDFLYLTTIQNQMIKFDKSLNLRSVNNEINKIYKKNNDLSDVILYVKKKYSKIFKNLNIYKIRKNKNKFQKFGYGSNDKKARFDRKYHYKKINLFLKRIEKLQN